jgi:hypothetical protein
MSHYQSPRPDKRYLSFEAIIRDATPKPASLDGGRSVPRQGTLERRSPALVRRAAEAGVAITYLGIAPVCSEPRAFAGPDSDWVMLLATSGEAIPRSELRALADLDDAGIVFPLIYVAHEVPKERLQAARGKGTGPASLDRATAAHVVGPVPPPASATMLADRLGRSSQAVLSALRRAAPIAGAIVASPFLVAGAAAATLAAGLDPVVFGAIPVGSPTPGQPAAWYVLASWQWSAAT